MDYKVEKIGKNKVKLEVTVPAEVYGEAIKKSFEKNREYFQIQGFRKGKAPFNLVKQRYGVEVLFEDADNIALNDSYFEIIEKEKIQPVAMPQIDIVSRGEKEEFKYTAEVETVPEFDLPSYSNMEVEYTEEKFSETMVDEEMESLREKNSRLKSLDEGTLEEGNTAVFDFDGFVDGKEFDGGSAKDFELEIGSHQFIDNFEEQMVGMKIGEEKEINVTFPEKYGVESLNGKPATFKVKLNGIKVKELPELDDEFASEVSEFETLEELRGNTSKNLRKDFEKMQDNLKKDETLKKLVEMTEIEIPDAMVDTQVDRMLNELGYKLSMQGIELKQYFEMVGSDEKATRDMMRPNAITRTKTEMVVEKLIENLKVEATEEEVNNLAEELKEQYKADDSFKERLLKENRNGIEHDVKLRKALDELVKNAKYIEPKKSNK